MSKYTIRFLKNEEFDKLPYKRAKDSLGLNDTKKNKIFVRDTGIPHWNRFILDHEIDHVMEKVKTHEYDNDGVRYKGGGGGGGGGTPSLSNLRAVGAAPSGASAPSAPGPSAPSANTSASPTSSFSLYNPSTGRFGSATSSSINTTAGSGSRGPQSSTGSSIGGNRLGGGGPGTSFRQFKPGPNSRSLNDIAGKGIGLQPGAPMNIRGGRGDVSRGPLSVSARGARAFSGPQGRFRGVSGASDAGGPQGVSSGPLGGGLSSRALAALSSALKSGPAGLSANLARGFAQPGPQITRAPGTQAPDLNNPGRGFPGDRLPQFTSTPEANKPLSFDNSPGKLEADRIRAGGFFQEQVNPAIIAQGFREGERPANPTSFLAAEGPGQVGSVRTTTHPSGLSPQILDMFRQTANALGQDQLGPLAQSSIKNRVRGGDRNNVLVDTRGLQSDFGKDGSGSIVRNKPAGREAFADSNIVDILSQFFKQAGQGTPPGLSQGLTGLGALTKRLAGGPGFDVKQKFGLGRAPGDFSPLDPQKMFDLFGVPNLDQIAQGILSKDPKRQAPPEQPGPSAGSLDSFFGKGFGDIFTPILEREFGGLDPGREKELLGQADANRDAELQKIVNQFKIATPGATEESDSRLRAALTSARGKFSKQREDVLNQERQLGKNKFNAGRKQEITRLLRGDNFSSSALSSLAGGQLNDITNTLGLSPDQALQLQSIFGRGPLSTI